MNQKEKTEKDAADTSTTSTAFQFDELSAREELKIINIILKAIKVAFIFACHFVNDFQTTSLNFDIAQDEQLLISRIFTNERPPRV